MKGHISELVSLFYLFFYQYLTEMVVLSTETISFDKNDKKIFLGVRHSLQTKLLLITLCIM